MNTPVNKVNILPHQEFYEKLYSRFNIHRKVKLLKKSARVRRIKLKLFLHEYAYILDSDCFYCREKLDNQNGYCLDRLDSSKGYIVENVIACCKDCNFMKGSKTFTEFYLHLNKIFKAMPEHEANGRIELISKYGLGHPKMMHTMINNRKFVELISIHNPKCTYE